MSVAAANPTQPSTITSDSKSSLQPLSMSEGVFDLFSSMSVGAPHPTENANDVGVWLSGPERDAICTMDLAAQPANGSSGVVLSERGTLLPTGLVVRTSLCPCPW